MLAAVVMATLVVIVLGFYVVMTNDTAARGSSGPLMESAPRSDPAPTFMQPGTRPDKSG